MSLLQTTSGFGAFGTIATTSGTHTLVTTSGTPNFPSTTQPGSLLFCVCIAYMTCPLPETAIQGIISPPVTPGIVWKLVDSVSLFSTSGVLNYGYVLALYYSYNSPSIASSVQTQTTATFNGCPSTSNITIFQQLLEFSAANAGDPLETFAIATGPTSNVPATANLGTVNTDLIVSLFVNPASSFSFTIVPGAGYTPVSAFEADATVGFQYILGQSPGSISTAWGNTADAVNSTWGCIAAAFTLTGNPPTVIGLNPPSGPTAGGTPVAIAGTNFKAGATVNFGSSPATEVVIQSSTLITCVSPPGPAGAVPVSVTTSGGTGTLNPGFTYVAGAGFAAGGVYERRYSCNGAFETSQKYGDVIRSLALSMAGWAVPPGPSWQIYAGAYVPPTVSFGDGDLRGKVKGDFRISARSICNGVKGSFFPSWLPINPFGPTVNSPASPSWRQTDFPPYQDAAAVAEDGGIPIWKDITLDFTTSLWTAQRIAKIICEQLRRQQTISPQLKIYALQLVAGDVVEYSHARWGLADATYQVQSMQLSADPGKGEGDDSVLALGVDLVLRETDPGVYAFAPPTGPTSYGDYSPYGTTGVGSENVG